MPEASSLVDVPAREPADRGWLDEAVRRIQADANRSADTHLVHVPIPGLPHVDLYLKDESTHPTGSLKHRLARSLFLYALCNGELREGTTVIEASSGSTAVSEAYFARMLGLPFIAVMVATTSREKIALIEREGGRCHLVDDATEVYEVARRLAADLGGHYLDQFTFAERATDWRGNNNIAESIFEQMSLERHPVPQWVVVGAGTGGTSATIGRYVRYRGLSSRVCVVDPERSAFLPAFAGDDAGVQQACGSRIEGIGRPRVEPSFVPNVVDRMMLVPDAASVAGDALPQPSGPACGPAPRPARTSMARCVWPASWASVVRAAASCRSSATAPSGMPAPIATMPGLPNGAGTSRRTTAVLAQAWDSGIWTG